MENIYKKYAKGEAEKIGTEAEETFRQVMSRECIYTKSATLNENKYKHTDIFISTDNEKLYGVDNKGHKRVFRNGPPSDKWLWVEIINGYGYPSYIYSEQTYISFEYYNNIYLVRRKDLQEFIDNNIDRNSKINDTKDSKVKFNLYRRLKYNQKELLTLIEYSDIQKLACKVWEI